MIDIHEGICDMAVEYFKGVFTGFSGATIEYGNEDNRVIIET